jgi:hypothetical protein
MCDEDIRIIPDEFEYDYKSHIKYLFILKNKQIDDYEQHCKQGNSTKTEPAMAGGRSGIGIKDIG